MTPTTCNTGSHGGHRDGAEADTAAAWLRLAWGDRAKVRADADGDLWIDVDLPDGRVSGTVASLNCPLLVSLTGVSS